MTQEEFKKYYGKKMSDYDKLHFLFNNCYCNSNYVPGLNPEFEDSFMAARYLLEDKLVIDKNALLNALKLTVNKIDNGIIDTEISFDFSKIHVAVSKEVVDNKVYFDSKECMDYIKQMALNEWMKQFENREIQADIISGSDGCGCLTRTLGDK